MRPVDRLLRWAAAEGRRPPWRASEDAYLVAAAEILLQKTKAHDAEPAWKKLIARFPSPAMLERAADEEVKDIVGGLGLGDQRTRRLKAMAGSIVSPGTAAEAIPGLGPYGSAIVRLSVGEDARAVPVDGNIARVMCRYYGLRFDRGEPRKKREVKAAVAKLLETQVDPSRKLRVLYGLIDLGEEVCRPRTPDCATCPLATGCSFTEVGLGG